MTSEVHMLDEFRYFGQPARAGYRCAPASRRAARTRVQFGAATIQIVPCNPPTYHRATAY
ncbi:MAG: hypothetical protein KJZ47_09095 [Gemmatimonadales bacterium]|nr:hypothetical protein [Gemmatimonadales bacterium]